MSRDQPKTRNHVYFLRVQMFMGILRESVNCGNEKLSQRANGTEIRERAHLYTQYVN